MLAATAASVSTGSVLLHARDCANIPAINFMLKASWLKRRLPRHSRMIPPNAVLFGSYDIPMFQTLTFEVVVALELAEFLSRMNAAHDLSLFAFASDGQLH